MHPTPKPTSDPVEAVAEADAKEAPAAAQPSELPSADAGVSAEAPTDDSKLPSHVDSEVEGEERSNPPASPLPSDYELCDKVVHEAEGAGAAEGAPQAENGAPVAEEVVSEGAPAEPDYTEQIMQLASMGFEPELSRAALMSTDGDVSAAVARLLS